MKNIRIATWNEVAKWLGARGDFEPIRGDIVADGLCRKASFHHASNRRLKTEIAGALLFQLEPYTGATGSVRSSAIENSRLIFRHCAVFSAPQKVRNVAPDASARALSALAFTRSQIVTLTDLPDEMVENWGIHVLRSPVRMPTATLICERLIGTIRRNA